MKVQIVSRECVKPSSPTPSHLKGFGLSLLDQLMPPWIYGTTIHFYTSTASRNVSETVRILRESLSQALVLFYPFAGRVMDATTIDCNDEGAFFAAGYADMFLHEGFLRAPDAALLNLFVPMMDPMTANLARNCLVVVQVTSFPCGGMAIAVCTSHKLVDASSACTFFKTWSALAVATAKDDFDDKKNFVTPKFLGGSFLPPKMDLPTNFAVRTMISQCNEKCVSKRFVFDGSKIASLKGRCHPGIISKVEVVEALILRCASRAASRSEPEFPPRPRTSIISQSVNLRKRMNPPLGDNVIGNYLWMHSVCLGVGTFELPEILDKIREGYQRFYMEIANRIKGHEGFAVISGLFHEREEMLTENVTLGRPVDVYRFTSLCKFPFYQIDFGWGRPIWVTSPSNYEKLFVLVDTRDGDGVDAWITLKECEMALLEADEEFLAYAKVNPRVTSCHSRM